MTDFLAGAERALLERNGLSDFDALWNLQLEQHVSHGRGRPGFLPQTPE